MMSMAKDKVTITVDRSKLDEARLLFGSASASAAIEFALTEAIRLVRLRRDVKAYATDPQHDDETALGNVSPDWAELEDDTDWEALWPANQ